VVNG
ncbi:hypothetical protein Hypma_016602, partial [Hypsizygus marmoreus]|jgi:coiled-coil and C2 domain-containing protein 2A